VERNARRREQNIMGIERKRIEWEENRMEWK
jgi:hypothetical protein